MATGRRSHTLLLAILTGVTALAATPVRAEVTVAVAPSFLRLESVAGGGGEVEIEVGNRGDEAFDVVAEVVAYDQAPAASSASAWTTVTPGRVHLEPGSSQRVIVSIRIPSGLPSGGRYAAVTFTTAPPGADGNVTTLAARLIVPIWLAVTGEGPLTSSPVVDRVAPVLESDGRVGFRAEVRNDGNVHVSVGGLAEIAPLGGQPIATLELTARGILPGASRVLANDASLPLPAGHRYAATVTFGSPTPPDVFPSIVRSLEFALDPALELAPPTVCENLDRGPTVAVTVVNPSGIGALPSIRFEVRDASGVAIASTTPATPVIAWPGEAVAVRAEVAERLPSGEYSLVAVALFGPDGAEEALAPFTIGGDPAVAVALCEALASGIRAEDG